MLVRSVGLWVGDEPVLGVICDFRLEELFSGIVGVRAWLNGGTVRVAATAERELLRSLHRLPRRDGLLARGDRPVIEQVRAYKKVRVVESAALSLTYVAAGRADAYYERGIRPLDVSAGMAIVRAAGRAVARESFPDGTLAVYAGTPSLPPLRLR
jgi:myo-inositol-1(or 4)-monophosphatase